MAMAKVEFDIDIHENSLDNSADAGDSELLGMVKEESYGRAVCDRPQLVSQSILNPNDKDLAYRCIGRTVCDRPQLVSPSILDPNDEDLSYNFRDLSGGVTYKLVHMTGEESTNNMSAHSPSHVIPSGEFYVISNPVEVYSTGATQKKVVRRQPLQAKAITAKKRDDKRRATHNEVERRRRDKINSWITKLAALVPNSGLPDTTSKGGILAKACDYITDLTEKQKRLEKLEVDNDKLVLEILRLNQELSELRKENSSMRMQIAENCLVNNMPNNRPKGHKS